MSQSRRVWWTGSWLLAVGTCMLLVGTQRLTAQTAGSPLSLQPGTPVSGELARDQSTFYGLSLPAGNYKAILDARRKDGRGSNLINRVTLVDRDGAAVKQNLIRMNEIDTQFRGVAEFQNPKAQFVGFKVTNDHDPMQFWLTVAPADAPLFPFCGAEAATPITLDQAVEGVLDRGQSAYFRSTLPKGSYRAILEFTNANGQRGNLIGKAVGMDRNGATKQTLVRLNEIDSSFRRAGTFEVTEEAPMVFRVLNTGGSDDTPGKYRVRYYWRLGPAN